MNILITGITGFVGEYLANELAQDKKNIIFGFDKNQRKFEVFPYLNKKVRIYSLDITSYDEVNEAIKKIKPNNIYHLAGFSSASGKDEELINKINVGGTLNILRSLKENKIHSSVLLISTSYIYGSGSDLFTEKSKTDPKSLYAKSKLKMENESLKLADNNLKILIARPVNHIGPGQRCGFVVPDFASQIVRDADNGKIKVGNLEARRDFLDVTDVVKAYRLIMEKGKSREIYNISSGNTLTINELLEKMIDLSGKKIKIEIDPSKFKPVDIKINSLSNEKILSLGWKPQEKLDYTLKQVIDYWKSKEGN